MIAAQVGATRRPCLDFLPLLPGTLTRGLHGEVWMEAVTGTKFTNGDLWETTKSGVYLCNLINKAAGIHSPVYLALVAYPRYTLGTP